MALAIDKPNIQGRTEEENIKNLQRWAGKTVDTLNYILSHLDETNFAVKPVFPEELAEEMDRQYQELRALIVARTQREV